MNNNLSESQMLVRRKHLNFDLEAFMNYKFGGDAAVLVITPNQYIMTECFVGGYYGYGVHEDTINAIYSSIYDDAISYRDNTLMLKSFMDNESVLFMLMCRGLSSITIIGVPKVITLSQYNFLVSFNEKIKEISNNNKEYFDKNPMKFAYYSGHYNGEDNLNNIDSMLVDLKERIGNVDDRNEVVLGESISNIGINNKPLFKGKILRKTY